MNRFTQTSVIQPEDNFFKLDFKQLAAPILKKDQEFQDQRAGINSFFTELDNIQFLDKDLVKSYSSAGAMHVLAVSGLHVGIIFLIVNSMISLLKIPFRYDWLGHFFILLIIWSYALITGLSPSILRATTMMSFFIIARVFNKHTSIYNVLFSSVFFLLFLLFEVHSARLYLVQNTHQSSFHHFCYLFHSYLGVLQNL